MDGSTTAPLQRYAPGTRATRALNLSAPQAQVDVEARTVTLAFSSEEPYQRSWGLEVLDHASSSIVMGRLASGGPLLMDHDSRDQVGVIEQVQIGADRVARAVVRFGKSVRASEVFQDVVDGIRRNVSVGYVIHDAELVAERDGIPEYRVTRWEPFEVSLVSVPADPTVGVGRSAADATQEPPKPQATESAQPAPAATRGVITMSDQTIDAGAEQQRGAAGERERVAAIIAIGEEFKAQGVDKLAAEAVRAGTPLPEFQRKAIGKLGEGAKANADIGMSRSETQRYSFVRALHALANPNNAQAQREAAFELEASRAAAEKAGKASQGVMVPHDVLKRDLVVGTTTAGGHTVATDLMSQDFITLLRNRMVIMGMGTRMMTGLQGNIAIPRHTGAATAYWVAESGAPTESQQAFDQVTMQPRTMGAFTDISRKLLLQSSIDVEAFVREDLATVLAQELQRVAINGSGTAPEPRGILNVVGIGNVPGGTNGLAPTYAHMVTLETEVAQDNADVGTLGYLTNAKVRGKLKTTEKASGTAQYVWADGTTPINGYRAEVTNAVPSNLTKGTSSGVCSAVIFGNFADLVIGMWGGLDLMVDPYTGSTSGTVRVVALQDVDVAVRHAESFAAMLDALTV
jgi:HK97 family phage major capsid protein